MPGVHLRASQFPYVDREGGEHLPINNASHVRNAMARFGQTEFASKAVKERARKKILSAAKRYGIEVSEDSDVARAAPRCSGRPPRSRPAGWPEGARLTRPLDVTLHPAGVAPSSSEGAATGGPIASLSLERLDSVRPGGPAVP